MYTSPRGDVALSLLAVPAANTNTVTMRVTSQPLVMWLWIGGGVIGARHRPGRVPGPAPPTDPTGVGAGARPPAGPRGRGPAASRRTASPSR